MPHTENLDTPFKGTQPHHSRGGTASLNHRIRPTPTHGTVRRTGDRSGKTFSPRLSVPETGDGRTAAPPMVRPVPGPAPSPLRPGGGIPRGTRTRTATDADILHPAELPRFVGCCKFASSTGKVLQSAPDVA